MFYEYSLRKYHWINCNDNISHSSRSPIFFLFEVRLESSNESKGLQNFKHLGFKSAVTQQNWQFNDLGIFMNIWLDLACDEILPNISLIFCA